MVSPTLIHYPVPGSAIEQPGWMLEGLEHARQVWDIVIHKIRSGKATTDDEDVFMQWVYADEEGV